MSRLVRPTLRERLVGDRLVLALLVTLSVALVATALALAVRSDGGEDPVDEAGAVRVARETAVAMTSYDHRTLDRDFARAERDGTPRFVEQYRAANTTLRGVIEDLEATARGAVREAAATSTGPSEVEVVMFVDQRITNGKDGTTRTDRSRIVMTVVRRGDRWLVDDVELR